MLLQKQFAYGRISTTDDQDKVTSRGGWAMLEACPIYLDGTHVHQHRSHCMTCWCLVRQGAVLVRSLLQWWALDMLLAAGATNTVPCGCWRAASHLWIAAVKVRSGWVPPAATFIGPSPADCAAASSLLSSSPAKSSEIKLIQDYGYWD